MRFPPAPTRLAPGALSAAAALFAACPVGVCPPCAPGEVCVRDVDGGDRCAPPAARGEVCQRRSDTPPDGALDRACARGLACELSVAGFMPTSICVPPGGPRLLDEPCREGVACDDGLACAEAFDVAVCRPGLGAACAFPEECASFACDAVGRCAESECETDDDCAFDDVCAGSECGRRCEPPAGPGERCRTATDDGRCEDERGCGAGLACAVDPVTGDGLCT